MTDTYLCDRYLIQEAKPSYARVLSNGQFLLLWLAQLISQSGDCVLNLALVWVVFQTTGSSVSVAQTFAVILLPSVLVGPVAGLYVDKFNHKDLMLASNLVQAAIVLAIAIIYGAGALGFVSLLVMIFLLNAGAQLFRPVVTATLPQIVDKRDLVTSNGLVSITTNLNQLAGYGIGGLIVALFGVTLPLYYDYLTFLMAFGLIAFLNRSCCAVDPQQTHGPRGGLGRGFVESFSFTRSNRILSQLVVVGVFIHFAEAGAYALFPSYAKITLQANSATYGYLLAMISAGTVLGSALVGKLDVAKHLGKLLLIGIFGMGFGFTLLGQISVPRFALTIGFTVGLFAAIVGLPIQVLLQSIVPPRLLGRVVTLLAALFSASQPIGSLIAGSIANSLTPATSLSLLGIFMAGSIVALSFLFKDLRHSGF